MPLKGNKGDWSELYVFAKLIAEGKLFQSDINLDKDPNVFYEVTKAYRENKSILEYQIGSEVSIYKINGEKRELIGKLGLDSFKENAKAIYKGILEGKGSGFTINEISDFLTKAHIDRVTALNTTKSDIKLRIYDHRLSKEEDLGFSIKSLIGTDSTLFNTGPGNNFIYEVTGDSKIAIDEFNKKTYKPVGRNSKISERLRQLKKMGFSIKYSGIESPQLLLNLKMTDGDLPEIIGEALLHKWIYGGSKLNDVIKNLEEHDPLNYYNGKTINQRFYDYKLKRFLVEAAMGMTSETAWDGIYDATGGVIIAKANGDVVCFHIYNFNLFREYLVNNTKFEQPSTGEDENNPGHKLISKKVKKYYYGWLYEEDGKYRFKINLQIRFN